MVAVNDKRVGRAFELLKTGLAPYVEREFKSAYRDRASAEAARLLGDDPLNGRKPVAAWDAGALLAAMAAAWDEVFHKTLGPAEQSLVAELGGWHDKWGRRMPFSADDAYRVCDSAAGLLAAVSARETGEVERMKAEVWRLRSDEEVRAGARRAAQPPAGAAASGGLKPWCEVLTPRPDVLNGRDQEGEFKADLWQAYLGEGADEYRDPVEFFRRTYLTDSLRRLLIGAVQRLAGSGGGAVVQLHAAVGGGKTHAMLALYHLFSGIPPAELPGVAPGLMAAGGTAVPKVRRAVLVGTRLSPGHPTAKPDGTVIRTLWGELAWQLGQAAGGPDEARKAFDRVRSDDERAAKPGDKLRRLFDEYAPCLILVDEWIAYARQLHEHGDLPGGSFETQCSFAQALAESARLARRCLLVVGLPASAPGSPPYAPAHDVEVGGTRGREALERLRNVIGGVVASWRPAVPEGSFEIVRRRLFEPRADPEGLQARDAAARAFADLYRARPQEFPPECREAGYETRLRSAYPIHPEIFDRLYTGWSALPRFQRTRGVLRLMAAVVRSLWEKGDPGPLVLPATIPADDPRVRFELTRCLPGNWTPTIERDVDGPDSVPVRLDSEQPDLGQSSACRRAARTVYFGSAPTAGAAHPGIERRQVNLGCVMPGESPAVFQDALRRVARDAAYLYQDGTRYWYSTESMMARLADDRAGLLGQAPDKIATDIERRVRADLAQADDFRRVHPFPSSSAEVPDDPDVRLVVLGTGHPYAEGAGSPALDAAAQILEHHGGASRVYRNALVFLAAEQSRLPGLDGAVRRYLAWESILADKAALGLSARQADEAHQQAAAADGAVSAQIRQTYEWLLAPVQSVPRAAVGWRPVRAPGDGALAARASRRLLEEGLLAGALGGARLRAELDRVPLWRNGHVAIRQLSEDFARHPYLPRLQHPGVLADAIRDGLALPTWEQETFAYAEGFDEATERYRDLRSGQQVAVTEEDPGLLVRPEAVHRQREAEQRRLEQAARQRASEQEAERRAIEQQETARAEDRGTPAGAGIAQAPGPEAAAQPAAAPSRLTRYRGSAQLDAVLFGEGARRIAEGIVAPLQAVPGAQVLVRVEIEATIPERVPEHVVQTVTENSRTLKLESYGFESE